MKPELYWVTELNGVRLAIMPRPRGGDWLEDEIMGLKHEGVGVLVSLLEQHESEALDLLLEPMTCQKHEIRFESFPVQDRSVPDSTIEFDALAKSLALELSAGVAIAIHCRGGIGRSSLLAGWVMHHLGIKFSEILPMLSRARGFSVPDTQEQGRWLERYCLDKLSDF